MRFGVGDVVRSAAAAESVEILAQMQADEAGSAPQMRGGGFAAQAHCIGDTVHYASGVLTINATLYRLHHTSAQALRTHCAASSAEVSPLGGLTLAAPTTDLVLAPALPHYSTLASFTAALR